MTKKLNPNDLYPNASDVDKIATIVSCAMKQGRCEARFRVPLALIPDIQRFHVVTLLSYCGEIINNAYKEGIIRINW